MKPNSIVFDKHKFITELVEVNMTEAQAKILVEMYLHILKSHIGVRNEPRLLYDKHKHYKDLIKAKMPKYRAEVVVRQYAVIFDMARNTPGGYDSVEVIEYQN